MKYLIFAFAIAFILEDYGTCQGKPIASLSSTDQIKLFKKYALNLVIAAVGPLSANRTVAEGGCECRLPNDEHLNQMDATVETMCIAKNYKTQLEALRNTSKVSDAGLMESIRKILVVLENWPEDHRSTMVNKMIKRYIIKYKRSKEEQFTDKDVESAMKCRQALYSLESCYAGGFFGDLDYGFEKAAELMRAKVGNTNDPRWGEINESIQKVSECELDTFPEKQTKETFRKWLREFNDDTTESDSSWESD